MPRFRSLLPIVALASFVSLPSFAALQPCTVSIDGSEVDALCGQYQVWENRQAKAGRKITLRILVLPALGTNPEPDPIVLLGGGPGQAATDLIGVLGPEARQDRDLLFVDQRGTGEPDRLSCLLGTPGDFQSLFEQLFPLDAVSRCRNRPSPPRLIAASPNLPKGGKDRILTCVRIAPRMTPMTKTQVYLRDEELEALHEAARRSGKSVADLVREAVRQVWLRPQSRGPVALWDGEPRGNSLDHDTIYDEP